MSLKLMYITNHPEVAQIAENAGVDRIFVDMEYIGKAERQGGMDTVQSHHTIADIKMIRSVIHKAELLVRCNPIHPASAQEIDQIVSAGADIIMLPYFKTTEEVNQFIDLVAGRVKTMLLLETPEAVSIIDEILEMNGIDEIHIGLNDLSLGYGRKFMFEVLTDGTVEYLCEKIKKKGIPYGFGGIATPGSGMLPAEKIIMEHYRLGSSMVILSRSFCNTTVVTDLQQVRKVFDSGVPLVREVEAYCNLHTEEYAANTKEVSDIVEKIVKR